MKNGIKRLLILFLLLNLTVSCTFIKTIRYWKPSIDNYNIFPQAKIQSGEDKFLFPVAIDTFLTDFRVTRIVNEKTVQPTIDEYLSESATTAFLVIKNDTIIYEQYYRGYDRSKISTFFSVTKSVTSLLVGIAIDEGYIKSVHDLVIDYIPVLKEGDPRFQKLTIEHLLNMQAGLRFDESYTELFSDVGRLYYGKNQLDFIKKLKFECDPGEKYDYNSATTAILGIVLEKAIQKPYAEYLEEKVWIPLGMEYDASMSLDDKKNKSAKAYQGLNATAIDLAKIGRLYMNGGNWNGKQIVSKEWIEKSITPNIAENNISGNKYRGYQYQWYSIERDWYVLDDTGDYRFKDSISGLNFGKDSGFTYFDVRKRKNSDTSGYHWAVYDFSPQFYAHGIMDQYLFVDPEKKIIIVRLGEKQATDYYIIPLAETIARQYPIIEKKW